MRGLPLTPSARIRSHGIGDDRLFGDRRINQAMHETGIGAVLQQPPHQIGEQVLMRADRRIDAHGVGGVVVQRLAHAVQALHLEIIFPGRFSGAGAGARKDERQAVRVVCGESGIQSVAALQHAPCAGEPAHVGRGLAGEDRIIRMTLHLRQLDLAVPVGALDQSRGNAMPHLPGKRREPVDHRDRALLVRLNGKTKPIPSGKPGICEHSSENVEADLEPVSLFRIDGEPDIRRLRGQRERGQRCDQCGNAALCLQWLVARMQRRELDRNARSGDGSAPCRDAADCTDRIGVGREVAPGIFVCLCRLAQHVEAIAQLAPDSGVRARQGFADGAAHDELAGKHAHAATQRGADHRLAHAPDDTADRRLDAALHVVERQHAAGQHERPGGGIHRNALAVAEMLLPVSGGDTVLDQCIGGGGIRDAQQCFGETEQRHAFGGAEAVLGEEVGDIGTRPVRGARGANEGAGAGIDAVADLGRECCDLQQRREHVRLRCPVEAADVRPVILHRRLPQKIITRSEANAAITARAMRTDNETRFALCHAPWQILSVILSELRSVKAVGQDAASA